MYPVTQVLRSDFPRSWQEAVALVQEVALALGDLTAVPGSDDLFLDEDGSIQIGFASEADEHPVTSLANLLLAALEGVDAPPQLRSLAVDNAKTPPAHSTVAGFTRALAFYERPDRRSDMHAIVTRLSTQKLPVDPEQELERLRERIAPEREQDEAPDHPSPAPRKSRPPVDLAGIILSRLPSRQVMIAAGMVAAIVGTLAIAAYALARTLGGAPPPAAVSEAPAAAPTAEAAPAPSPSASGKPSSASAGPATPQVPVAKPTARSSAAARVPEPPQAPMKSAARQSAADSVSRTMLRPGAARTTQDHALQIGPLGGVPSLPGAYAASAGELSPEAITGHVYSAAEPDVVPARLTRSQLPHEPSPNDETGYFDIVVDERGDVEFIKLLSPTRRYQDRMLVAAAKAWKFSPALLNGTPVKYRLQIPIILHDVAR